MAPKLLAYLARATLVNQYATHYPAAEILKDQQIILLFFSSVHDADTALVEQLVDLYRTVHAHHIRLEVVHVPTDVFEPQARDCFAAQGNWYTLPHGSGAIDELLVIYNVIGTPSIMVIKRDGSIISREGDDDLRKYGSNALVAWS